MFTGNQLFICYQVWSVGVYESVKAQSISPTVGEVGYLNTRVPRKERGINIALYAGS